MPARESQEAQSDVLGSCSVASCLPVPAIAITFLRQLRPRSRGHLEAVPGTGTTANTSRQRSLGIGANLRIRRDRGS